MEKLSDIAHYFDCDIYIHQHRMKNYNFKFFGKKEYLNVKSILSPKYLEATHGEKHRAYRNRRQGKRCP